MKEEVRVSLIQFAPAWLDRDGNAERMAALAEREATDHGAELVIFPELANLGYIGSFERSDLHGFDLAFARKYIAAAEMVPGPTTRALGAVAARHKVHVVVGLAQLHPTLTGVLYNSGALIGPDGSVVGLHHKAHIPAGEKHYFIPGNTTDVFETGLGKLGITICYDGRFPELSRVLALKGAEMVCAIWARPRIGNYISSESNRAIALVRAQENAIYYLHCNRSGIEGDTEFLGFSAIGAPNGAVIAGSETKEEDVVRATLSNQVLVDSRAFLSIYRDRRPELYAEIAKPLSASWRSATPAEGE